MFVSKPPKVDVQSALEPAALSLTAQSELVKLVQRSQREYFHWDKVRHLPTPEGVSTERLWATIKFFRLIRHPVPLLTDKHGRPFSYTLPDVLNAGLHVIDRSAGQYLGADVPEAFGEEHRQRYIISSLMDEAIASSQIEGAVTTRRVAREMLEEKRAPKTTSERMIRNNYQTIMKLREDWAREPLTLERLHEIHGSMTAGTLKNPADGGRLRQTDDIEIVDQLDQQTVHKPPPFSSLPDRLQAFLEFANSGDGEPFIHPVVRAIILHFWLAYDHPYVDGNGRTARAVFYWYLLRKGYWLFEYLPMSRYILRARRQYYRAFLYTETDDNDLTYFLVYHTRAVTFVLQELQRHIRGLQQEVRAGLDLLQRFPGLNPRQRMLLREFLAGERSHSSIAAHQTRNAVVYQTARLDLLELERQGFVTRMRVGRKKLIFAPAPDLATRLRAPSAAQA